MKIDLYTRACLGAIAIGLMFLCVVLLVKKEGGVPGPKPAYAGGVPNTTVTQLKKELSNKTLRVDIVAISGRHIRYVPSPAALPIRLAE